MRLSDAIRLGALLHPQCFNQQHVRDQNGRIVATCAIGAARAAGFDFPEFADERWS